MMMCYAGIDLHATNSVLVVIDDADRVLYQKRLRNDLPLLLTALKPYRVALNGIAVESTYIGIGTQLHQEIARTDHPSRMGRQATRSRHAGRYGIVGIASVRSRGLDLSFPSTVRWRNL